MKKKVYMGVISLVLVFLLVGVCLLVGCVQQKTQTSSPNSTKTTENISSSPATTPKVMTGKIGFLPKLKNINYMDSCAKGAEDAAKELGLNLTYDGPTEASAELQIPFIKEWIAENYDIIAVSANDPNILAPVLKEAMAKGITVVTWDADTTPDAREFFINQATYEGVGYTLVDKLVEEIGENASIGILTASLSDKNQNMWLEAIKQRIADKYPNIKIVVILPGQHDAELATTNTKKMLQMYPEIRGIIVPESESFPAAAKAVKELGKKGQVAVIGLTTPLSIKEYVKEGIVKNVVLWKTEDLGYLTVYTAKAIVDGKLKPGDTSIDAGRLGNKVVIGDEVLLGDPFVFTIDNIDEYNY